MATIIEIYVLLGVCLITSLIKSRGRTKKAFKIVGEVLLKSAPALLTVLGIVGLTLGTLTPETISRLVGAEAGDALILREKRLA